MSLELVNTFGTLLTVAIIAATAIAAMVQLRHLRAGNQINAMLSIGNQFDDKEYRAADALVQLKAGSALDDPRYRDYEISVSRGLAVPTVPEDFPQLRSAMNLIGNTYEELGILVKKGIIDKELFLDRFSWPIAQSWKRLAPFTAFSRDVIANDAIWENFEYLAVLSQDWMVDHPTTYPAGMRRLEIHNPWPVPPKAATA